MSAKAQERIRAEKAIERARIAEEMAAEEAEMEERFRPVREAGPPGGCHECWRWHFRYWPAPGWVHGDSAQPGPCPPDAADLFGRTTDSDWCYHACHDDGPVFCGPIAMAAC